MARRTRTSRRPSERNQAQQQHAADVASIVPDDFEVNSADRQASWDALPAAAKGYITQLRATCSNHVKRVDELAARCLDQEERIKGLEPVVDAAWRHRFSPAQSYKVAVLKQAHAFKLQRLQKEWDDRRFRTGVLDNVHLIQSLDSMLLEAILCRLDSPPPLSATYNREPGAVHKRQGDAGWHARRVLAQVCRLFEALAYTLPTQAHFNIDELRSASNAPPGFACRDLERAVLSPRLSKLVLTLPVSNSPLPADAAASLLRHCPALQRLALVLPEHAPADSRDGYCIPPAILEALPACAQLSDFTIDGPIRIQLSSASAAALLHALVSMPKLRQLDLSKIELPAQAVAEQPFDMTLSKCESLREFDSSDANLRCSWKGILRLPLEAVYIDQWTRPSRGSRGDLVINPTVEDLQLCYLDVSDCVQQLTEQLSGAHNVQGLNLHLPGVAAEGHSMLAKALPRMQALRHLYLAELSETGDFEAYVAALQGCTQLKLVSLERSTVPDSARWVEALVRAIQGCPILMHVELVKLSSPLKEPLSLGPLWQALPDCKHLRIVSVADTKLRSTDACVLCPVLERCDFLEKLSLTGCGLEQESVAMLQWAVRRPGIEFDAA